MAAPVVLLAEEDRNVQALLRQTLEDHGYHTLDAASAADLWQAVDKMDFDAIVLDTAMRGSHDTDMCRALRERSDVPIILVGANSTELDRVVGLELGADDFLCKPYSARELLARLRAVLRRGRGEPAPSERRRQEARFDGWHISFARRELRDPAGGVVGLTGAEFELLTALSDQPQRVIARDQLMKMAGSRGHNTSDRSIDVLISRVRRKLTHGSTIAPIVTVRGMGYMLSSAVEHG